MKYILSFLFGGVCGAGLTLVWLRGDIKKHQESLENDAELPFTAGDENTKENKEKSIRSDSEGSQRPSATSEESRVAYHRIIEQVKSGKKEELPIPVLPRDDVPDSVEDRDDDDGVVVTDPSEGIVEIDIDEYLHDDSNNKERLVYFRGDGIMATESGEIITNPAVLVGTEWEEYVDHYADKTAFLRNHQLVTDYEIYVEYGTYEEEYGPLNMERED